MSQPVPVLFIHGYNGDGENWEEAGFPAALAARGADPELLWRFHYGWTDGGAGPVYDNQGDIRAIAARLAYRESDDPHALRSQLRRLSAASVARGGPARVTIVAHSMGGLVARYYLSRREPDEWGTVNEGVVGRLITISTPHLGVEVTRVLHLIPPDAFIWTFLRWLQKLPFVRGNAAEELALLDAQVQHMQLAVRAESFPMGVRGLFDSPALQQMMPGSDFLQALNQPGSFPADVEAALLWGDVQLTGGVRWGALPLWERTLSLGDLLISAASASTFPHVEAARTPFLWRREYRVQIGNPALAPYDLADYLPPVAHTPILHQPEVHEQVARLIGLA